MRGAGFGAVLSEWTASLTGANCCPVPYTHPGVCFVTERLVRPQSPSSLGDRANASLRPALGLLRELGDARKPGRYGWYQPCALRLIRHRPRGRLGDPAAGGSVPEAS